ncbi:hypothetical protein SSS_03558 [Sarcoptes scabiei]|uniref:Oxidative stress-responsive serine-rich protein 1 n=1 Tax=Sarcoptes scabiei TaxID=52283 RepID=A0A834QZY0_SARSC|nr:hypothetical protein SSS_03558 [Sarcoptes scabiei]
MNSSTQLAQNDDFGDGNDAILPNDVRKIQTKLKRFCFDPKQICRRKIDSKLIDNPFKLHYKSKSTKSKQRLKNVSKLVPKKSFPRGNVSGSYVIDVKEVGSSFSRKSDNRLINDIDQQMAALWNKDGYRNNRSENYSFKNPISFVKNETNIRNEMNQNFPATSIETINTNSQSCARQALNDFYDSSVIELAAYLDETLFIPKKMSFMAEMMYT